MAQISIISMLASFPILAYHFYEFSIISMIANIIFVPFYSLIVLPTMLILFCLQFIHLQLFSHLIHLTDKIIYFSERVATTVSPLKFSVLITGKPGVFSMTFMLLAVYLYMLFREQRRSYILAISPLII